MSQKDSSWDDVDPSATVRRRKTGQHEPVDPKVLARTTDETGIPAMLREPPDLAPPRYPDPAELSDEFDYEDVGPTNISDEIESGEHAIFGDQYEALPDGSMLGERYRIERVLGRGATGLVYDALDTVENRHVAIKVLFPHVAVQPTAVQRLFREAKIAARVQHPNVLHVYEGGRDGDNFYLVMELLEGRPMGALIQESGALPLRTVATLFDQVLSGVAAVHDEGVVHRDIKPDNIFLVAQADDPLALGVPKVLDFGISKIKASTGSTTKLTAMGTVMGTPYYMAPEQLADTSSVGVRADVYSLGVMLYEAVTGSLPYEGESVVEIFTAASEGRWTPPTKARPDCPPALATVIGKALSAAESDRYEDVHAMRAALRDALQEHWPEKRVVNDLRGSTQPLAVEPTRAMVAGYVPGVPQPTPLTSRTVELPKPAPSPGITQPQLILYLSLAAAGGGIFVAFVALVLYLLLG